MKIRNLIAAGVSLAALSLTAKADVTVVITGGNASKNVLFERAAALLNGETVVNSPTNTNIRSYVNGTITGQAGLGNVTIHFVLLGAAGGITDLRDQTPLTVASTVTGPTAQLAVTGVAPETIGVNGSIFQSRETLVVPFVFVKNSALAGASLAGVTNLTQRQAAYLEAASGFLPTAFFGGESTSDPIYLVGRNTDAAVRQIVDASIYFSGTPSFWTATPSVVPGASVANPQPFAGHTAGSGVLADLNILPNAIGTVSSQDIGTFTPLSYEGVPFSAANVAKGFYPIWGYERWLTKTSGPGTPTAAQKTVIDALFNFVTDFTYQHTAGNAFANAKFVPLGDLEVKRVVDGGPILSTLY